MAKNSKNETLKLILKSAFLTIIGFVLVIVGFFAANFFFGKF